MKIPFRVDLMMLFLLPFLAALGAWFSKQLKTGRNGFFFLLPLNAVLTGTVWATIAKTTRMPLTAATILFDIVYSLSYFFACSDLRSLDHCKPDAGRTPGQVICCYTSPARL